MNHTALNPDNLDDSYAGQPWKSKESTAATYHKYGDVYVVSVPRVVRAVFNVAAQDPNYKDEPFVGAYKYEWFTPPDSQPIPYSKVIELREKQLGNQTKPCTVKQDIFFRKNP